MTWTMDVEVTMFPRRVAVRAAGRSLLTVALDGINSRQAKTGQGRVARVARVARGDIAAGIRECGTIFAVSDYARASDACFRIQAVTKLLQMPPRRPSMPAAAAWIAHD